MVQTAIRTNSHNDAVQAQFNYWAKDRINDPEEVFAIANGETDYLEAKTLAVHDVRPEIDSITHETHGFQIVKHESRFLPHTKAEVDLLDPKEIKEKYWSEVRDMVKKELCCRSIAVLSSVVRESSAEAHQDTRKVPTELGKAPSSAKPFHLVHNDYSPPGARAALRAVLPTWFEDTGAGDVVTKEEREEFFRRKDEIIAAEDKAVAKAGAADALTWDGANYEGPRWAHFSIWRPIEPVQQDPLAMLDPHALFVETGLLGAEHKTYVRQRFPYRLRPGHKLEHEYTNLMPLMPRDEQEHQWYWLKDQQPNEVNFLKLFDSEAWKQGSKVMPCAPHSAISLPESTTLPPRRSIETRVLVMW